MKVRKLLLLAGLAGISIIAGTKIAHAAYGRADLHGYFDNISQSSGESNYGQVIVNGVPSRDAESFISFIGGKLNGGGRDAVGASFIVHTMLGYSGGNGTVKNISSGDAKFVEWSARVRDRANKGKINWNLMFNYSINSGLQRNVPGFDVAAWTQGGSGSSIVFYNDSNQVAYVLKHDCANPVGELPGLPNDEQQPNPGNARLTIQTSGLPSGTSVTFTSLHHTAGNCGSTITFANSVDCTSGVPNGIGWHLTGHTQPGGIVIRAPASVTAGGTTYTFSGWSGGSWSDGAQHCTGLGNEDRCVNIPPGSNGGTNTGSITANYSPSGSTGPTLFCSGPSSGSPTTSLTFTATGTATGTANWSTTGGASPSSGTGTSFTTSFSTGGSKTVTVSRAGLSRSCSVNISAPAITCNGPSTVSPGANATFTASGASSYNWSASGGANPSSRSNGPSSFMTSWQLTGSKTVTATPTTGGSSATCTVTVVESTGLQCVSNVSNASVGEEVTFTKLGPVTNFDWRASTGNPNYQLGGNTFRTRFNTPGTHRVLVIERVSGGAAWQCSVNIASPPGVKPYLKIYGNDAMAGGGFGEGCSVNAGRIRTSSRSDGLNIVGASTQYAAFASGIITGFNSGTVLHDKSSESSGASGSVPPFLSFANESFDRSANPLELGGGYQDEAPCVSSYFDEKLPAATFTALSNLTAPNADKTVFDHHYLNGNINFSAGLVIQDGARNVFFVDGTVTIGGDITYQNTTWSNRDDIPAFYIVARNINIGPTVKRLDGIFIAEPTSASDGIINTCSGIAASAMYAQCKDQLTIFGAFIAQKVDFYRTFGKVENAVVRESAGFPAGACDASAGAVRNTAFTCAGEVFRFSPEAYLTPSPFKTSRDDTSAGEFDSFGSLPPIL